MGGPGLPEDINGIPLQRAGTPQFQGGVDSPQLLCGKGEPLPILHAPPFKNAVRGALVRPQLPF